ncbi:MAG: prolyl oligopeptidase family serine peptidase [Pirellulales bacterium]
MKDLRRSLRMLLWTAAITGAALGIATFAAYWWWFQAPYERVADVVYGQRGDEPLLLDVFRPPQPNGAGIIVMVSGSWKSGADSVRPFLFTPLLHRGYTVFAVRHLSQPACLVSDIVADVHRAVRFIRHNCSEYGVDPERLGVTGGSSGGHLALMLATCGAPGPADSADPVDRESSAVECVACFFPVTDLLHLGTSTENPGDGGPPIHFKRGFGPRAATLEEWKILGGELSPIEHVTAALPPILIVHGDADTLVPLQQSQWFVERARGVGRDVQLEVRPGKGHGWPSMIFEISHFADFFDEHLVPARSTKSQALEHRTAA